MTDLALFNNRVFEIRGQRVMLDRDVAAALGVETKHLNENASRSPKWGFLREQGVEEKYRFKLTMEEITELNNSTGSQDTTSLTEEINYLPWVYTELGCVYFSTSLNSEQACAQAVQMSKVFVKVKQYYQNPNEQKSFISETSRKHAEAIEIMNLVREAAITLGNPVSISNVHAVTYAHQAVPFVDLKPLLSQNESEDKEYKVTPTEIGKLMGLSAREVNKLLEKHGLQYRDNNRRWRVTEKGQQFGRYIFVGKKRSDGSGVDQLKWLHPSTKEMLEK